MIDWLVMNPWFFPVFWTGMALWICWLMAKAGRRNDRMRDRDRLNRERRWG